MDLWEALRDADAYAVELADEQKQPAPGSKSAGVADVALWASVAAASRPAAQVLITAIREWCAVRRERSLEVKVYADGHSVTVMGSLDAAQERLVHEFLDQVASTSADDGPGEDHPS
ncbi:hypothetical protein ABZ921_33600 [Streptomyces atriruber]|uniref:BON domain-containing protein n=1 Tax=Streptomyces atriruber TaxID=545121 RepID=A0ABV3BYQ5_9ACTN